MEPEDYPKPQPEFESESERDRLRLIEEAEKAGRPIDPVEQDVRNHEDVRRRAGRDHRSTSAPFDRHRSTHQLTVELTGARARFVRDEGIDLGQLVEKCIDERIEASRERNQAIDGVIYTTGTRSYQTIPDFDLE